MNIPWIMAATLALALGGGALEACAGDWRQGQNRGAVQWRSPPPAWGYSPSLPRSGGAHPPFGGRGYDGGDYSTYNRDRQRWRDTPYDRHESRHRDYWHEQGRDQGRNDWRGWRQDWRDDDRHHQRWPSGHGRYPPPAHGPYAPRGPHRDGDWRYDD